MTEYFDSAQEVLPSWSDTKVACDGHVITSQGPGTSLQFGLKIVESLYGKEKSAEIAKALLTDEAWSDLYPLFDVPRKFFDGLNQTVWLPRLMALVRLINLGFLENVGPNIFIYLSISLSLYIYIYIYVVF